MEKSQTRGGKKGRKIGRNKDKCRQYAIRHRIPEGKKRFTLSKEKRGCGPLGYYQRMKKELEADEGRDRSSDTRRKK